MNSERDIENRKLCHQQNINIDQTNREISLQDRELELENRKQDRARLESTLEYSKLVEIAKVDRARKLADLKKANTSKQMQILDALETGEEVFGKVYFNKVIVQPEKAENDPATKLFNQWFAAGAKK